MNSFKLLDDAIIQHGDAHFCCNSNNVSEPPISWNDLRGYYLKLVTFLEKNGLKKGSRIGIFSSTRIEWTITDFASLYLGAITIGIYKNDRDTVIEYELKETKPDILFLETYDDLKRIQRLDPDWGWTKPVVIFEANHSDAPPIHHFTEVVWSNKYKPTELKPNLDPNTIASFIFTSGTTSFPKIAVLTQSNLLSSAFTYYQHYPITENDRTIAYLPFSHVFSRVMFYASTLWGACHTYEKDPNNLVNLLRKINPTTLLVVPRILEKVKNHIDDKIQEFTFLKKSTIHIALNISKHLRYRNDKLSKVCIKYLDQIVLRKFREPFGSCMRFMGVGGGKLDAQVCDFFYSIGLPVYEGYALTETGGLGVFNHPNSSKIDSIGRPISINKVTLSNDGEILISGPTNAVGYLQDNSIVPLDDPFPTGDIATIGDGGYLKIIDRKKDIFVSSNGKNISPSHIESMLKNHPLIDDAAVFGDGKPYLVAAIVINSNFDLDPKILLKLQNAISSVNLSLSRHEAIKKFFISAPFEINAGTLTPTMKKRRKAIERLYQEDISRLYMPEDSRTAIA